MTRQEDYQKTIYDGHVRRHGLFKGDQTASIVLRIVRPYVVSRCLDIGAGSGALVRALHAQGYDATGIDLYRTSKDIIQGSITDIPFGPAGFDTVFCCDVIEHLADDQMKSGLKEVYRILKTGGHFVVTIPFDEDLRLNKVSCPKCGHEFHRYGHLQSFDAHRITGLLMDHGLRVIFLEVYALGAMAKLPLGRHFNCLFRRLQFEFIGKSIVLVAQKPG